MAKTKFTAGRVADFQCNASKSQSFLWDSIAPGLGLRATTSGAKSYIFQAKLKSQAIRVTIGSPATWTIKAAQAEARRLMGLIDGGKDPREVKAAEIEAVSTARAAKELAEAVQQQQAKIKKDQRELTARMAWDAYLKAPHPKWGDKHRTDHKIAANPGGALCKIGGKSAKAAPLAALLCLPLHTITDAVVKEWLEAECQNRPTFAHNSYRKFRTFINWCAGSIDFQHIVQADCCTTSKVKDVVPEKKSKYGDCLQREQLAAWFDAIRKINNPVISSYLQALLITGARRNELQMLKWGDIDFRWCSMTIRDKVEGVRTIPLTPYLATLLGALPRRSDWVFSSLGAKSGHITEPRIAHNQAIEAAGLPHVSLHGLRRSFGTLSEWVEIPTGVVAQIQGHKPSALAEKHYRRRSIDMLRKWHDQIEAWMLEQAGISFVSVAPGLRVVTVA